MKIKILAGLLILIGTCSAQINNGSSSSSSGTVTSMSSGNLVPLFTTSVATPTATPALSFTLTNAAAGTLFGNSSGSAGAPSYTATPTLGVAGTAGTLTFSGVTSGSCAVGADATGANHTIACGIQLTGASGAATTISTSTSNANLILTPNGTGFVQIPAGAAGQPGLFFAGDTAAQGLALSSVGVFGYTGSSSKFAFTFGATAGFKVRSGHFYCFSNSSTDATTNCDSGFNRAGAKAVEVCTTAGCSDGAGFLISGNKTFVTSDFTTASASLVTITGLSWTLPVSTAVNFSFHCALLYSQATAAAANAFGIQGATTAPTNIAASGLVWTSTTVPVVGTLATLTTTTATNIVTFTPSAITTVWRAELDGTIEAPSNASPTVFNIMALTGNVSDSLTIKRGSYCALY